MIKLLTTMSVQQTKSRQFALHLAGDFFRNGCFEAAGGGSVPAASPASMSSNQHYDADDFLSGFAGLSVQGVGCDETIDEEKVYVYVTKGSKKQLSAISADREGVSVKVVNVGKTIVKPEMAASTTHKGSVFLHNNRIACGSSCQPAGEDCTGTIGAIVKRGNELFALSNNHVFAACNHVAVGQPIMSPSYLDASPTLPSPRVIAKHSGIVELRSGNPDLVPTTSLDVAFAAIEHDAVTSWQGSDADGYDTPTTCVRPVPGMSVKKFGRTSGLTFGIIESEILKHFPLSYQCKKFKATVWFQRVWMIRADNTDNFALAGDSGSLVVTADGKHAVGLLFATALHGTRGYIMPIENVLDVLKMSLIGGHGL